MEDVTIDALFDYSNARAQCAAENEEELKGFLRTAAFCRHYTVANQLLIHGYAGYFGFEAKDVRTKDEWENEGIMVREGQLPIYVMEYAPGAEKSYIPRQVFDVSQTDAVQTEISHDTGLLTEALLLAAPCPMEYQDALKVRGTKAYYFSDENIIRATKGFKGYEEIFAQVSREYAHYYIHRELRKRAPDEKEKTVYPRAVYTDTTLAAAYIVCSSLKMDTSGFLFSNAFQKLKGSSPKEIKKALEQAVVPAYEIINTVSKQVQMLEKWNERGNDNAR